MKVETLVYQQRPPTPPMVSKELRSGLHQVAQYVAGRHYSYDEPRHGSAYGSPRPVGLESLDRYSTQLFHSSNVESTEFGLHQYVRVQLFGVEVVVY